MAFLNLAQCIAYVAIGQWISTRWPPGAALLYGAAGFQTISAALVFLGRGENAQRWLALACLFVVSILFGLHVQLAIHVIQTFTPVGAELSWAILGGLLLALPWLVAVPLFQLLKSPRSKSQNAGAAVALALLLLPPIQASRDRTTIVYPEVPGALAASWLHAKHQDLLETPPPEAPGPTALLVHLVRGGKTVETRSAEGENLQSALLQVSLETQAAPADAILLEAARTERSPGRPPILPSNRFLSKPGVDGFRLSSKLVGAHTLWRSQAVRIRRVGIDAWLPTAISHEEVVSQVMFDAWLATKEETVALERNWTAPPEMTPKNIRRTVLRAARHLVHNMSEDGRFAYIVKGPSGDHGAGYNYPRHAGGAWFLAQVARWSGDPEIQAGALSATDFMVQNTQRLADGRAFFLDPRRKDGQVWVGTTALALMALIDGGMYPDLARAYAKHIASAVDDSGIVRGNFHLPQKTWPEQDQVTYAQGQGLLALAAAVESGNEEVGPALERAAKYVEQDYWPMPAARLALLDEHWMCLAAERVSRVREKASGEQVCRAWVDSRLSLIKGSPLAPAAGPAGAVAEAVVAAAMLDLRRGTVSDPWYQAIAYGELFLANTYQPQDAPFLENPENLIGGFRDKPWLLDVRVDAVQHIGFALMGVQELLESPLAPKG